MKYFVLLGIFFLYSSNSFSQNEEYEQLAKVKYYIINGNIEQAEIKINQEVLKNATGIPKMIRLRYESIIAFLKGNYKQSANILMGHEFRPPQYFKHICSLKILLGIINREHEAVAADWRRCKHISDGKLEWPQKMVELFTTKSSKDLEFLLNDIMIDKIDAEEAKFYLKLSLYIQKEYIFLNKLTDFPQDFLNDPEIREILGMLFYRKSKYYRSFNLIEDLKFTNAENIKGDILLLQKKYELAYPQFKLVWANRFNSKEALLRGLPLSWHTKQWEDGLTIINKLPHGHIDDDLQSVFISLFYAFNNDHQNGWKRMTNIPYDSPYLKKVEVAQLKTLLSLHNSPKAEAKFYAKKNCDMNDVIFCWIYQQFFLWDDFTETLKQKDEILPGASQIIGQFKIKNDKIRFNEEVIIDQRYIEELDESNY